MPKDLYLLPDLNKIVDVTTGHEVLSFMDAFSGYNQIKMCREDKEKTIGSTYQQLMKKMFHTLIGKTMEV